MKLKLLATLALATGIASAAWAVQNRPGSRPFFAERLAQLGLTDAQLADVKKVLRTHLPAAKPVLEKLVTERRQLRATIHAETVDETAIRAQAAKVAALEADLAVLRATVAHEIKPVLTAEQIEKLKAMGADVDERVDAFLDRVAKRITED